MIKNYLFYTNEKDLNKQAFLTKNTFADFSVFHQFTFSINGAYALYDNQLLAWIPPSQNLYEDNLEYLSNPPISFSIIDFGAKKISQICCNSEVVHAITEDHIVFSWGSDSKRQGLLGMGPIYAIKSPTVNKTLTAIKAKDISMSEEHGAAVSIYKSLYTWGNGSYGQLGNRNLKASLLPKQVVLNIPFNVLKVECGKNYTCGITISRKAFIFGKLEKTLDQYDLEDNLRKDKDITFLSLDNDINGAEEVYGGEKLFAITSFKGWLYLYIEPHGLYQVKVDQPIQQVKFIGDNFYAINRKMDIVYEFIHYSFRDREFDINDYAESSYFINANASISMLRSPFYIKVLFFTMNCSEKEKEMYERSEARLFSKANARRSFSRTGVGSPTLTSMNESKATTLSAMTSNQTNQRRISKITTMLSSIFEKQIDTIENNNRSFYSRKEDDSSHFFLNKKRIELIKVSGKDNNHMLLTETYNQLKLTDYNNFSTKKQCARPDLYSITESNQQVASLINDRRETIYFLDNASIPEQENDEEEKRQPLGNKPKALGQFNSFNKHQGKQRPLGNESREDVLLNYLTEGNKQKAKTKAARSEIRKTNRMPYEDINRKEEELIEMIKKIRNNKHSTTYEVIQKEESQETNSNANKRSQSLKEKIKKMSSDIFDESYKECIIPNQFVIDINDKVHTQKDEKKHEVKKGELVIEATEDQQTKSRTQKSIQCIQHEEYYSFNSENQVVEEQNNHNENKQVNRENELKLLGLLNRVSYCFMRVFFKNARPTLNNSSQKIIQNHIEAQLLIKEQPSLLKELGSKKTVIVPINDHLDLKKEEKSEKEPRADSNGNDDGILELNKPQLNEAKTKTVSVTQEKEASIPDVKLKIKNAIQEVIEGENTSFNEQQSSIKKQPHIFQCRKNSEELTEEDQVVQKTSQSHLKGHNGKPLKEQEATHLPKKQEVLQIKPPSSEQLPIKSEVVNEKDNCKEKATALFIQSSMSITNSKETQASLNKEQKDDQKGDSIPIERKEIPKDKQQREKEPELISNRLQSKNSKQLYQTQLNLQGEQHQNQVHNKDTQLIESSLTHLDNKSLSQSNSLSVPKDQKWNEKPTQLLKKNKDTNDNTDKNNQSKANDLKQQSQNLIATQPQFENMQLSQINSTQDLKKSALEDNSKKNNGNSSLLIKETQAGYAIIQKEGTKLESHSKIDLKENEIESLSNPTVNERKKKPEPINQLSIKKRSLTPIPSHNDHAALNQLLSFLPTSDEFTNKGKPNQSFSLTTLHIETNKQFQITPITKKKNEDNPIQPLSPNNIESNRSLLNKDSIIDSIPKDNCLSNPSSYSDRLDDLLNELKERPKESAHRFSTPLETEPKETTSKPKTLIKYSSFNASSHRKTKSFDKVPLQTEGSQAKCCLTNQICSKQPTSTESLTSRRVEPKLDWYHLKKSKESSMLKPTIIAALEKKKEKGDKSIKDQSSNEQPVKLSERFLTQSNFLNQHSTKGQLKKGMTLTLSSGISKEKLTESHSQSVSYKPKDNRQKSNTNRKHLFDKQELIDKGISIVKDNGLEKTCFQLYQDQFDIKNSHDAIEVHKTNSVITFKSKVNSKYNSLELNPSNKENDELLETALIFDNGIEGNAVHPPSQGVEVKDEQDKVIFVSTGKKEALLHIDPFTIAKVNSLENEEGNSMTHVRKLDSSSVKTVLYSDPKELESSLTKRMDFAKGDDFIKEEECEKFDLNGFETFYNKKEATLSPESDINNESKDIVNEKLKLGDLRNNSKPMEIVHAPRVITVKSKEELLEKLQSGEYKDEESVYYLLEGEDNLTDIIEDDDESLMESQSTKKNNSQIIKVKNKKVISITPQHKSLSKREEDGFSKEKSQKGSLFLNSNRDNTDINTSYDCPMDENNKKNGEDVEWVKPAVGAIAEPLRTAPNVVNVKSQLNMLNKMSSLLNPSINSNSQTASQFNQFQINQKEKKSKSSKNSFSTQGVKGHFIEKAKQKSNKINDEQVHKSIPSLIDQPHQPLNQKTRQEKNSIKSAQVVSNKRQSAGRQTGKGHSSGIKDKATELNNLQTPKTNKASISNYNQHYKHDSILPAESTNAFNQQVSCNKDMSYYYTPTFKNQSKKTSYTKAIKPELNQHSNANANLAKVKAFISRQFNRAIEANEEDGSYKLLKSKYTTFLENAYGNGTVLKAIPKDDEFLHDLAQNRVPIEEANTDLLQCSSNMKEFMLQSLENFKLKQVKEKLDVIVRENVSAEGNNDLTKSNLLNLIALDDEDELKDKSNMLEPMELDKSWMSITIRKSFVDSLKSSTNESKGNNVLLPDLSSHQSIKTVKVELYQSQKKKRVESEHQ